ncbi:MULTISPECIES: hypothetical protein [Bacillaceae]|uniref:hypothetical protein n=1 Tax=Bacillaceae TaxID=186817 RepID=UPI0015DE466C|nr:MULTISPECIES: hypothetical protein [Bacillaceae]QNG60277.1 hypothetical protein H4O14_01750 [Bacillus sp. PAMC26568]
MDMNTYAFEKLRMHHKEELDKKMQFNETYHLYSAPRKKICMDLILFKICI